MSITTISKMTLKNVVGKISKLVGDTDATITETTDVMRVMGIARKVELGNGDNGAVVRFVGNFKGLNLLTSEEFISSKLSLPADAEAVVLAALLEDDGDIEFAFDVAVYPNKHFGYSVLSAAVIEIAPVDPMAALAKKAGKAKKTK